MNTLIYVNDTHKHGLIIFLYSKVTSTSYSVIEEQDIINLNRGIIKCNAIMINVKAEVLCDNKGI